MEENNNSNGLYRREAAASVGSSSGGRGQPGAQSKLFRFSTIALMTFAIIVMGCAFVLLMRGWSMQPRSGTWDGLSQALAIFGGVLLLVAALPALFAGISGARYKKGKSKNKLTACWTWAVIAFIMYLGFVVLALNSFKTGDTSFNLDEYRPTFAINSYAVVMALVTLVPVVLFMFGCLQEQLKKNNTEKSERNYKILAWSAGAVVGIVVLLPIVMPMVGYFAGKAGYDGFTKVEVNEANLPTLSEFAEQLKGRGFIYDLPEGMTELVVPEEILTESQDYKYARHFSVGVGLKNRFDFGEYGDTKFPVYVYDAYVTLIQKSSQTADYYNKGPEDWTVSWYIYDIDGQIFAAIGSESKMGDLSYGGDDLFGTDKAVIVAEEDKITTYNRAGDYFAYGGCIDATWSTAQRTSIPKMSDQYDADCARIEVVDRVDAETLDNLAKKIVK